MIAPIYNANGVTLFYANCMDVLSQLARASVDLLATDPPWGVKWKSARRAKGFGKIAGDDSSELGYAAIRASFRVLKPRGHLYVFGPFTAGGMPVGGVAELVWDKENIGMGDLSLPWGPSHERILFGVHTPSAANRAAGDGKLAARQRRGSILRHQRPNSRAVRHPSEKPVALMREIIESSTCFGDTVFDPFGGTCSTAIAAMIEGRRCVTIECDERWCEMAVARFDRCAAALAEIER